ncbi:pantoate--beta-alanine ligase [Helicobacter sp. MIT 14-3879]|uniref:pantoate--beta-alanine ligase n=1 Tax=Helicobacter sp. MIT 14-3879 TaxID=2040649 RepID=UPI000E1F49B3|nr:pantoate--beta-alanine ligase [Helicobacter sp. MIT 14-3879]RDU62886.1 pantoate--beta-alanine ligase [Helicobacter sp. MIT 14-3879]
MIILRSIKELKQWRESQDNNIGFTPTMGALHNGHLSLIEQSKKHNNKSIVSIFVNPTQFSINEDLNKYPRNEEKDIELCKNAGVDAIFIPSVNEMYPHSDETNLIPPINLANVFEGSIRNGHFSGVLRIIIKLFHLIKPNNAYFGKKDAQQLLIIKKMVNDLFLDINIIGCPIIRDCNNLALSSRNTYLDSASYNLALKIPQSINLVKEAIKKGEVESNVLENIIKKNLLDFDVDYCNVVNYNLEPIQKIQKDSSLLLLAVRINNVRLLDNIWF